MEIGGIVPVAGTTDTQATISRAEQARIEQEKLREEQLSERSAEVGSIQDSSLTRVAPAAPAEQPAQSVEVDRTPEPSVGVEIPPANAGTERDLVEITPEQELDLFAAAVETDQPTSASPANLTQEIGLEVPITPEVTQETPVVEAPQAGSVAETEEIQEETSQIVANEFNAREAAETQGNVLPARVGDLLDLSV